MSRDNIQLMQKMGKCFKLIMDWSSLIDKHWKQLNIAMKVNPDMKELALETT